MRRFLWLLCGVIVLTACGCTQVEETDAMVRATYEPWVGFVSLIVGVVASVLGWLIRKDGWRSVLFLVFAVAATVLYAPFAFFDHVTVTQDKISTQWGFWLIPNVHEIKFDDVTHVILEKKTRTSRRGRRSSYSLNFYLKDRSSQSLSATNSLMEETAAALMAQLQSRGITIQDQTGD